jgi:hypothetical protein
LQRETLGLLERLITDLAADAELALPQRLISRICLEIDGRPLVRALLMSDKEVLGSLTADEAVAAAQKEMTGQPDRWQADGPQLGTRDLSEARFLRGARGDQIAAGRARAGR